tara:strand:+ start:72 stop:1193 length:1122 start_codon:yes stop_codon:yes gene_type:complete
MSGIIGSNLGRASGSIGSAGSGITTDSGDPATDTNPDGGVGTVWSNTTSGETYVCTDATAGANVWTNVGDGTGDISPVFGGATYGYALGGRNAGGGTVDTIQKISFADGTEDMADVANLTVARQDAKGSKSSTHGYAMAGNGSEDITIDKHQFATTNNSTDVGDLTQRAPDSAPASSSTHGYLMGGNNGVNDDAQNVVQNFPFSSDTGSTDIGNLTALRGSNSGHSDWTNQYGYVTGGYGTAAGRVNIIDRVSFAAGSQDAADVGDLTQVTNANTGSSSAEHGYSMGGHNASAATNVISRFAFAATANAADVGDLTSSKYNGEGMSSLTHAYYMGASVSYLDMVERTAFASSANGADVGNLLVALAHLGGTEI